MLIDFYFCSLIVFFSILFIDYKFSCQAWRMRIYSGEVEYIDKHVNEIHLRDHGMEDVTPRNFINLREYLLPDMYIIYSTLPVIQTERRARLILALFIVCLLLYYYCYN